MASPGDKKDSSGGKDAKSEPIQFSAVVLIVIIISVVAVFVFMLRKKIFSLDAAPKPVKVEESSRWEYDTQSGWNPNDYRNSEDSGQGGQNVDPPENPSVNVNSYNDTVSN